ncbi:MAG: tetratricopeptide repeat protein [Gemmatimonadota bacterium]
MLKRMVVLASLTLLPGAVYGQTGNTAVIAAQPSQYQAPTCEEFRGGHFKVKSGATYIQSALSSASNRERLLSDADRVLREAITTDNQASSPAAWYWLGRVYLYRGDVGGADTSLAKAQQLAPNCADEVRKLKLPTYAALMRPASELMQAGNPDSALIFLRQAASFSPDAPYAYQNMGIIYFNKKQLDSAATAFEKAVAASETKAATDTAYASLRTSTTFNLAAVYQNAGRHKDAVEALHRYLGWNPADNDAKRALANSFRALNMVDSAKVIESQLLTTATAGGGAPGSAGGTGAGVDVFDLGVKAFTDKNYEEAARAFHQALADNPNYRDALFNLANTYIQMNNGDSLVAVGERLVGLDPMNEDNLRLLARGYQIKKRQEQTLKYVVQISELPVNVQVATFQPGAGSATLVGSATGRAAKDISEKPIAAVPLTLVFEFLDASGKAVTSQEVAVKALPDGEKQDFTVTAQGEGIVAWRYSKK